jgi:hypothetical protein
MPAAGGTRWVAAAAARLALPDGAQRRLRLSTSAPRRHAPPFYYLIIILPGSIFDLNPGPAGAGSCW